MKAENGALYPILGLASCVVFICMSFRGLEFHSGEPKMSFVKRNGTNFMADGRVLYVNGWNSYWLMDQAVEEFSRPRVRKMFQTAAKMGLTVCRTWAFNDGAHNALQVSLGRFDERVFKALDYVIVEAHRHGMRLLLSLVNNFEHYGGKTQYVRWAWEEGIGLTFSNDSFFFDPTIRRYFKIYLKTILARKNHLTGIEYRDDPTIFAWELMNEPQCISDASGDTLQASLFLKTFSSIYVLLVIVREMQFHILVSSGLKWDDQKINWYSRYQRFLENIYIYIHTSIE